MSNIKKRTFVISATVAAVGVLVGASLFGINGFGSSAEAADALPPAVNAEDIGDGGIDLTTLKLAAETEEFQVWTAHDRARNTCVIASTMSDGNTSAYCADEKQLTVKGIPGSMQVGVAEQGDTSALALQTYLLPEGADAKTAVSLIPGSQAFGQLIVRFGPISLERSERISIPSPRGSVDLLVLGRDSM